MRDEITRSGIGALRTAARALIFGILALGYLHPASADTRSAPRQATHPGSLILDATVTVLVLADEPSPVAEAARDLTNDFEEVLGQRPRRIHRLEDAGPVVLVIGEQTRLPEQLRPSGLNGAETFSITVVDAQGGRSRQPTKAVLLAGADMRGTIYAVYEFSRAYLDVDPMSYWTDRHPPRRSQIELPFSLKVEGGAPVFKYRGFFVNDEDLLTGWAPGEKGDGTGISLEVWNKIFETILRLKGNMVAPGTWIFSDEPQVRLAGKRGLIVTQHHAIPLGLNVARWPQDPPYSYTRHPEVLEKAWRDAAAAYDPDQEVLWTVGLRGLTDATYAAYDPSVRGNDRALGELISKAIQSQIRIVRSLRPNAQFITSLWMEGARLLQQGHLTIPSEVAVVWADDGYGYLEDKGRVAPGNGAYYHVAMLDSWANQLTEMVPVERIVSEIGRYIKAGATQYLLLNTSDIRPVAMTAKAVMEIAWKGLPQDADKESDRFYLRWSSEEFGEKAGPSVAEIYKEYFRVPAHQAGHEPTVEYGDNYYHSQARRLMLAHLAGFPLYHIPGQSPPWVSPRVISGFGGKAETRWLSETLRGEIQRCRDAQPRWDRLWTKALEAEPLVVPHRRPYYRAHVLAMIAIGKESNRILTLVAEAVQEPRNGEILRARHAAEGALGAFDKIWKAEAAAEYGKWKNWYRGDWLVGIPRTQELVKTFLRQLDDPLSPMPEPVIWHGWEGYYHIRHYQKGRLVEVK